MDTKPINTALLIVVIFVLIVNILLCYKTYSTVKVFNNIPRPGKTYYEYDVINNDTIPVDTIMYDY